MYCRIFPKEITEKPLLKLVITTVLILLPYACSPILHQGRMYTGPPLQIKKICIITPESSQKGGISIIRIDGQHVMIDPSETVELLPGKHPLEVIIDAEFFFGGYRQTVRSRDPVTLDFVCEGGNVYLVGYALRPDEDQYTWNWEPFIENITNRPDVLKYIQEREDKWK